MNAQIGSDSIIVLLCMNKGLSDITVQALCSTPRSNSFTKRAVSNKILTYDDHYICISLYLKPVKIIILQMVKLFILIIMIVIIKL